MEPVLFIIGFIVLAVVIRLLAGSFDGERVERYLRDMGCELVDRSWDPFAGPDGSGRRIRGSTRWFTATATAGCTGHM